MLEALGGVLEVKMSQESQQRAKSKIPRESPSGLKPPRTHPGGFWGHLGVLGGVLEVFTCVLEALDGVLEAKDSTKMGQERAKSNVPGKLQSGLTPPRTHLGGSRGRFGY